MQATFNRRVLQYKHVSCMPSKLVRHGLEQEDGGGGDGGGLGGGGEGEGGGGDGGGGGGSGGLSSISFSRSMAQTSMYASIKLGSPVTQ